MSPTETLMVLVLGFVLALIVVLLVARMVWNIGQRLAKRRADRDRPALIRDLEATRDQLRAGHAMMEQKLHAGLAEARAQIVTRDAEVSRHRNRVQTLIAQINDQEQELARRDAAIAELNAQVETQAAAIEDGKSATELYSAQIEKQQSEIALLKSELAKTIDLLDQSRDTLKDLKRDNTELERTARKRHVIDEPAYEPAAMMSRQPEVPLQMEKDIAPLPADTPRKRFDFTTPEKTLPPLRARPEPHLETQSDLAGLLSSARKNMMRAQSENQAAVRPEKVKGNRLANVVSIAQKLRSSKPEE